MVPLLDDTAPEDTLARLDYTVWAVQAWTLAGLLDKTPNPTLTQIREGMNKTLCRCMTYYRIQAAIQRAAKTMADARQGAKNKGVA